ncbi:MAG: hypothetical protein KDA85_06585 [Planctomycetaceae bacterium]|nr:hypothetical protein [Planctomycetaceae bacterium]
MTGSDSILRWSCRLIVRLVLVTLSSAAVSAQQRPPALVIPADEASAAEQPTPSAATSPPVSPRSDSPTPGHAPAPAATTNLNTNLSREPLTPEATQLIRGILLLFLPQEFSDDDDWGAEKRIQSGLDVELRGLRLETRRRWNDVNHGSWKRASGRLVDPEQFFRLQVWTIPSESSEQRRYALQAQGRIRVTGQQQQWNSGVMLWSISGDATADVTLNVEFDVEQRLVQTDRGPRFRMMPTVRTASVQLNSFHLHRVSHIKGTLAAEFGRWLDGIVQRQVHKQNERLVGRINQRLQRKPERFEFSLGLDGWVRPVEDEAVASPAEMPSPAKQ